MCFTAVIIIGVLTQVTTIANWLGIALESDSFKSSNASSFIHCQCVVVCGHILSPLCHLVVKVSGDVVQTEPDLPCPS